MSDSTALEDRIREAVRSSRMSRYRIATECGVNRNSLYNFLLGKAGMSVSIAGKVCEFLGLELEKTGQEPDPKEFRPRGRPKKTRPKRAGRSNE